ncbi:hypothetical protein C3Z06_12255 [Cupriavidus metallidurans]|nr:hypothetical protein C3Z06_12255 [Cupriavidus metallidurans]
MSSIMRWRSGLMVGVATDMVQSVDRVGEGPWWTNLWKPDRATGRMIRQGWIVFGAWFELDRKYTTQRLPSHFVRTIGGDATSPYTLS